MFGITKELSIKNIGLIGANLAAITVLIFAVVLIHQEYYNYEKQVQQILASYKHSEILKDKILEEKRDEHKKKVMRYITGVGGLSLFMYFTIFGISRVISYIIENEMDRFLDNFAKSAKTFEPLDSTAFTFSEIKSMVQDANLLIQQIELKQHELQELNLSLEDKVKAKTLKLQNLIKAQDEFVKKSIHEVNTPLSIILTNIDLLKMKQISNKQLSNIESASKMINNIFNDLSYLIKKDRVVYEKQKLSISTFLKERISFFDEVAKANRLFFDVHITPDVLVWMNEVHLARIIDNNISNAIKYSFANKPVYIGLNSTDAIVTFYVKTFSQNLQNMEKIFDEYYREHTSRGGFGLGLKIVKDICDENQIAINVYNDGSMNCFEYHIQRVNG